MNLNFKRSYKFQTEDPQWKKKVALLGLVYACEIIILTGLMLLGLFVPLVLMQSIDNIAIFILFPISIIIGGVICLPFTAFMNGYWLEITENVMNSDKQNLPELTPVSSRMKKGFELILVMLPQNGLMFIATMPILLSLFPILSSKSEVGWAFPFLVMMLSYLVLIVLSLIIGYIFNPAQFFIFAKYGKHEAFNYGKVLKLAKNNFSSILKYDLVVFLGSYGMSALAGIPIIGVFCVPFVVNMIYHLEGQVFAELDQKISAKNS